MPYIGGGENREYSFLKGVNECAGAQSMAMFSKTCLRHEKCTLLRSGNVKWSPKRHQGRRTSYLRVLTDRVAKKHLKAIIRFWMCRKMIVVDGLARRPVALASPV